jgi:hypothetical protein
MDLSDLRFAWRIWTRHPMTLAVTTLSLGLGVGATTVMYSLLSRVTHYEVGFANEDRLVVFSNTSRESGEQPPTYPIVQALLKSGKSFEAFGSHQPAGIPVTISGAGNEASRAESRRCQRAVHRGRRADSRAHLPSR